jgi:hypothetical protein
MREWLKVVTDPLGLAGFALFILFGYAAKVKRSDERRWLSPLAAFAGIAALIGGLAIGYVRVPKAAVPSAQTGIVPAQQQTNRVQQTSSGAGSPNVQGVQGNVTIRVDQTADATKSPTPTEKQPDQKK